MSLVQDRAEEHLRFLLFKRNNNTWHSRGRDCPCQLTTTSAFILDLLRFHPCIHPSPNNSPFKIMPRRRNTYGRREASDSEDDEDDEVAEAIALENALSRLYTVNVTTGQRASKRVRYEEEEDQVVEKAQVAINVDGIHVPIAPLASAVNTFIMGSLAGAASASEDGDHEGGSGGEMEPAEDQGDEDLDDLLLSFGPQLRLEEKDDDGDGEDRDVNPANVVEFSNEDIDNEKVSECTSRYNSFK